MVMYMQNRRRIKIIEEAMGNSSDIIVREVNDNLSYIYLESVSSDDKISNFLLKSIVQCDNVNDLLKQLQRNIYNSHIELIKKFDDVYYYLASGYTCLFIDSEENFIVIETKAS